VTSDLPLVLRPLDTPETKSLALALTKMVEDLHRAAKLSAKSGPVRIVLVSRRMVCVYFMLVRARDSNGTPVVSESIRAEIEAGQIALLMDRTLDGKPDDFVGTSFLVDDCLILGSTLLKNYVALKRKTRRRSGGGAGTPADPGVVKVFVPCYDDQRHNPLFKRYMVFGNRPLKVDDRKQIDAYSLGLAQALYQSNTPYFTDFPIVRLGEVPKVALSKLLSTKRWKVIDVTTALLAEDTNQRAYTLLPESSVSGRFARRGCKAAVERSGLLKVRLWVHENPNGTADLSIVPISVPQPLFPEQLGAILLEVTEELRGTKVQPASSVRWSDWKEWEGEAQHRLLQMHLSTCLLAEFWDDLLKSGVTNKQLNVNVVDADIIASYFGSDNEAARYGFARSVALYREGTVRTAPAKQVEPLRIPSPLAADERIIRRLEWHAAGSVNAPTPPNRGMTLNLDPFWVQQQISTFGYVGKLEALQQVEYRNMTVEAFLDESTASRYIERGISMLELSHALVSPEYRSDSWSRDCVSLVIDIANDLGAAVPVTAQRYSYGVPGLVARLYRVGENTPLIAADHNRLAHRVAQGTLTASTLADALDPYTAAELLKYSPENAIGSLKATREKTKALFGPTLNEWHGVVSSITNETLSGYATNFYSNSLTNVEFAIDLESERERSLRPGDSFVWRTVEMIAANDELVTTGVLEKVAVAS
jgi:hypothetical protein